MSAVAVYPKSVEDRNIRNARLTEWDNRTRAGRDEDEVFDIQPRRVK
jgi:hypothetical protein